MNKGKFLRSIIAISATLVCVAGFGVCKLFAANTHGYVSSGLAACYNSEDQTPDSLTWINSVDSASHISLTDIVTSSGYVSMTSAGLYIDDCKIRCHSNVYNLVKSKEFTIELFIQGFTPKGASFNTFINSNTNDNFSVYRNASDDCFYVKTTTGSKDNLRPKISKASSYYSGSKSFLISVTYRYGVSGWTNKCRLFVNGVLTSTSDITDTGIYGQINISDLYVGQTGNKAWSGIISSFRVYNRALDDNEVLVNYNVDKEREKSTGLSNTPVRMYFDNEVNDNRVMKVDFSTQAIKNDSFNITLHGPVPNNSTLAITQVNPIESDFSVNYGSRYAGKMTHKLEFSGSQETVRTVDFKNAVSQTVKITAAGNYYMILYDNVTKKLLSYAKFTVVDASTHKFNTIELNTAAGLNQNFVPFDFSTNKFTDDVKITVKGAVDSNMYLIVSDKAPGQADFNATNNIMKEQIFYYVNSLDTTKTEQTVSFASLQKTQDYPANGALGISAGKTYYLYLCSTKYVSACVPIFVVAKKASYQKIGLKFDNAGENGENIVKETINSIKDTETVSLTGDTSMLNGANAYFFITDVEPTAGLYKDFCACRSYMAMGYVRCSNGFSTYSNLKIANMTASLREAYQGATLYPKDFEAGKTYYITLVLSNPNVADLRSNVFVVDYKPFIVADTVKRENISKLKTVQVICGNDLAVRVTGGTILNYFSNENWKTKTNPFYSEFNTGDVVDYTVRFTINEKVNEVKAGSDNLFVLSGLKFTDMQATLKIELCKDGVVCDTVDAWSVKEYLEKDKSQIATELLRLGSALIKYQGGTGFEVTGGMAPQAPQKPSVTLNPTRTNKEDYFYAGSLFLDDNVNLVFKYHLSKGTKLVITGEGQSVTITGNDLAKERAESTDVFATGYGNKYTATLYDANGNVLSKVDYSVLTYIYDKYDGADTKLKEVLDALYGLYKATL